MHPGLRDAFFLFSVQNTIAIHFEVSVKITIFAQLGKTIYQVGTTIKDIADKVGVSPSTVSLVLNGKAGSHVSHRTKHIIERAAEEMNYQVNEVARSLRTGQSGLISVIVTDISNEVFSKFVFHVQEEAKKQDYLVLTICTNENAEEFSKAATTLIGKHIDGIICVTPPGGESTLRRISEKGIPMVLTDRKCEGVDCDFVGVNNYVATLEAVNKLIEEGCSHIAIVGRSLEVATLSDRIRGYKDALVSADLYNPDLVKLVDFEHDGESDNVRKAMKEILEDGAGTDAIFFTSRRVFSEAMTQMAREGGKIRPDISILCFDDVSSYLTSSLKIRHICQPIREMAGKAFELLTEKMNGKKGNADYIFKAECR